MPAGPLYGRFWTYLGLTPNILCYIPPGGGGIVRRKSMSSHKTPEVISRLAKIGGHVRGIKKMAEEGRSCEELLLQISAV
jgi:hypothetical protein